MFSKISAALSAIYTAITSPLQKLFARHEVDEQTLVELERILIQADLGALLTKKIIAKPKAAAQRRPLSGPELRELLAQELRGCLVTGQAKSPLGLEKEVILLVGINGSGKTTLASKLVYQAQQDTKKVLLVAADTFRAAATEQLSQWANKLGVAIITGTPNEDPSAVVFRGCQAFLTGAYDVMIIDTAGRLQTKVNLMHELQKIKRVISKQLGETAVTTLLVIDSMLGQNSLEQAKLFHACTPLDGIVLTKMDGTGKGGIACAIVQEIQVPIRYLSYGEEPDKLLPFDAETYIKELLG